MQPCHISKVFGLFLPKIIKTDPCISKLERIKVDLFIWYASIILLCFCLMSDRFEEDATW